MYHLWRGLEVAIAASVMSAWLSGVGEFEDLADQEAQAGVDPEEEDRGDDHHDPDHHRGDPGLPPAGPGDLLSLGVHLAEELDRIERPPSFLDRRGGAWRGL